MTFVLAFLCTGQVDTWDPLCDTDDLVLSVTVTLTALIGIGWAVARRLKGQAWYLRWPLTVAGAVGGAIAVAAVFTEFAHRFLV